MLTDRDPPLPPGGCPWPSACPPCADRSRCSSPRGRAARRSPPAGLRAAGPGPCRRAGRRRQYRVLGPRTLADRNAVARTGAAIDCIEHGVLHVTATAAEARAIQPLGFTARAGAAARRPAGERRCTLAFPPADSDYHDYAEMIAEVNQVVADHPAIARKISIGTSYEGRDMIADQDLRQRRHRRERAGDPVQRPPARPRAPDRRDGALPAQPVHRQLRHRLAGSPTWSTAARSGSCPT